MPSTLEGFECALSFLPPTTVHYTPIEEGDTATTLAVSMPSAEGWLALGVPTNGLMMVGTTCVIATTDAVNGEGGVFELTAQALSGVNEAPPTTISDVRSLPLCRSPTEGSAYGRTCRACWVPCAPATCP